MVAWRQGSVVVVAAVVGALLHGNVFAQEESLEGAKDGVVMLRTQGPATSVGAGLIIGIQDHSLHVLTARHVVRDASSVHAQVRSRPGQWFEATILELASDDLAALIIHLPSNVSVSDLKINATASTATLARGSDVYPLGYPGERPWNLPVTPDRVASKDTRRVIFQSQYVEPGNSGGPLVDACGRTVGLVVETERSQAQAIAIESILETLSTWSFRRQPALAPSTTACDTSSIPATTDFFIYAACQANDQVFVDSWRFPFGDIRKNASPSAFRSLVAQLPNKRCNLADATIFRLRDEYQITVGGDVDATQGGNLGVIMIPPALVKALDGNHVAFTFIRSHLQPDGRPTSMELLRDKPGPSLPSAELVREAFGVRVTFSHCSRTVNKTLSCEFTLEAIPEAREISLLETINPSGMNVVTIAYGTDLSQRRRNLVSFRLSGNRQGRRLDVRVIPNARPLKGAVELEGVAAGDDRLPELQFGVGVSAANRAETLVFKSIPIRD